LILLAGYQVILTRFPSRRDVVMTLPVTELTNQQLRFNDNPQPMNLEHLNLQPTNNKGLAY
jgi:hypothetical protein